MKAQINIAPRTGVGMGFMTVGENANPLAEFSKSLRDSIKIINAKIACGPEWLIYQYTKAKRAQCRDPNTRKPVGFPKKNDFYRPNSWPKVTITEITRTITTSYVKSLSETSINSREEQTYKPELVTYEPSAVSRLDYV
jgi:hypothetical protein